ncbi:739_t:CDS:2 [Entrophospora sp. SA101]|nr:739_t:CDS:2 [Entrophospora sp. SA101]
MSSSSYINNTRRRSTPSVFIDSISEEDIKLLLSSKTPNIISKRRGSAVSINSITSTTRRTNAKLTTTTLLLPMEINDSFQDFTKFNDFYFQTSSTSSSEIEKEGLKAILNSKIPLFYFLYSLLEEYSSENLFFFLKVEQYESKQYDNSTQQLVMAQQIFDTYLTRNSQFEVNIDDRVRKLTIAAIKSERDLRYCFRDAKQAVFVLLENSFSRFIRSNLADTMRKEIGEHTAHYSNEARELSVGWLFKYLEKLGPIDVNEIGIKNFSNIIIDNSNNQGFNQVFDYEGWEIDNSNSNSNHYRCNYSGSERNNSNSNIYGGANGKKQELKYKKTKDLKDHLIRNFSSKNQI